MYYTYITITSNKQAQRLIRCQLDILPLYIHIGVCCIEWLWLVTYMNTWILLGELLSTPTRTNIYTTHTVQNCIHCSAAFIPSRWPVNAMNTINNCNLTAFITQTILEYTVEPLYNGHFGTWKTVCYREVSTIESLFYVHSNLFGPTETVCYREVFIIRGVCYKRFHCIKYT